MAEEKAEPQRGHVTSPQDMQFLGIKAQKLEDASSGSRNWGDAA